MSFNRGAFYRALWLAATAWLASACGQGGGYAGGIRAYAYYVYVTNQGAGTISAFSILGSGNLVALNEISSGGNAPVGIVVDPTDTFVYALNSQATGSSGSSIGVFTISAIDGSLTENSVTSLPASCSSLALDPGGRFIYATCASVVATLTVTGDGSLSGLQTTTVTGSVDAIQVDPNGKYVYAANSSRDLMMSFSVSGSGSLTAINTAATGSVPSAIAVDPKGRFVVTANIATGDVSVASIASGSLTAVGNYSAGSGSEPRGVAVDPTGSFVYATANGLDTVNSFAVESDFSLVTLSSYATDLLPTAMTFSPDGVYAVVVNNGASNDIYLYDYTSGGTLAYSSEGAADSQPSAAAIARFLGPSAL